MVPRTEKESKGKGEKNNRPCMHPKGAEKGSNQELASSSGDDSTMKRDRRGKKRHERQKNIENHGHRKKKADDSDPGSSLEPWDSLTQKVAQEWVKTRGLRDSQVGGLIAHEREGI